MIDDTIAMLHVFASFPPSSFMHWTLCLLNSSVCIIRILFTSIGVSSVQYHHSFKQSCFVLPWSWVHKTNKYPSFSKTANYAASRHLWRSVANKEYSFVFACMATAHEWFGFPPSIFLEFDLWCYSNSSPRFRLDRQWSSLSLYRRVHSVPCKYTLASTKLDACVCPGLLCNMFISAASVGYLVASKRIWLLEYVQTVLLQCTHCAEKSSNAKIAMIIFIFVFKPVPFFWLQLGGKYSFSSLAATEGNYWLFEPEMLLEKHPITHFSTVLLWTS